MNLNVLLSCMCQENMDIIQHSNVQSDVVVINQCLVDKRENSMFSDSMGNQHSATIIHTTERGLSNSRNMAIANAIGDICLFCDDDEILENGYTDIIVQSFRKNTSVDILAFIIEAPHKRSYPKKEKNVGYIGAMKISSCQIAFRRKSVVDNNIEFDKLMGSGTGNGGGEEIRFLFDCLRKGLKIKYCPVKIASVAQTDSKWFDGFTNKYFLNRGWSNRRILGLPLACCYALYFSVKNYPKYRSDNTFWNALYYQLRGSFK